MITAETACVYPKTNPDTFASSLKREFQDVCRNSVDIQKGKKVRSCERHVLNDASTYTSHRRWRAIFNTHPSSRCIYSEINNCAFSRARCGAAPVCLRNCQAVTYSRNKTYSPRLMSSRIDETGEN